MRDKRRGLRQAIGLAVLIGGTALTGTVAAEQTLTVEEAVSIALERNLALLAERHDLDIAEAEIVTARLRPNPELSLEGEHFDTRFGRTDDTEYAAGLAFEIEGFGKRPRRIDVAEHARSSAEFALQDQVRELVFEVRSGAVDVMLLRAHLQLARDNHAAFEEIVAVSEARYRAGDIDGAELTRSRLALRHARNEVRQHEVAVANARQALALLLGTGDLVDIDDTFRSTTDLPAIEQIRAEALAQRPDILAARSEAARAEADVQLQRAERRPDFTVGTELRRMRHDGNFIGVSVSVPLPLFDRNQGEIARAQSEHLQAGDMVRALEASIASEIATGYTELALAQELLASLDDEMLDDARRLREISEFAYQRGETSLLELLDANMAFNEAMQDWYAARAEMARSLYLLDFLTAATEFP